MARYHTLPTFSQGLIRVVVETPKGAAAKFTYEPKADVFEFGRALPAGLIYPYDWGFIPSTVGADGDALDGLVVHHTVTAPGIVIHCRLLGALMVEQTEEGRALRNDRFVLYPAKESADDAAQSGVPPRMPLERSAALPPPVASATPVPANAGRDHKTDVGDSITLGIGLAGVGALGIAAAGGVEGVAVGGALLAKNIGTAAKAYGPKLAEDWKVGAARLKTATGVGHVAAEQTTAALTDYARSAVVGAGVSAGAALAQHVVHAVTHHPSATKPPSDCPRP